MAFQSKYKCSENDSIGRRQADVALPHEDNFMDFRLLHACVWQDLLHRLERSAEQIDVKLLEFGPRDTEGEVNSLMQWLDLQLR